MYLLFGDTRIHSIQDGFHNHPCRNAVRLLPAGRSVVRIGAPKSPSANTRTLCGNQHHLCSHAYEYFCAQWGAWSIFHCSQVAAVDRRACLARDYLVLLCGTETQARLWLAGGTASSTGPAALPHWRCTDYSILHARAGNITSCGVRRNLLVGRYIGGRLLGSKGARIYGSYLRRGLRRHDKRDRSSPHPLDWSGTSLLSGRFVGGGGAARVLMDFSDARLHSGSDWS